MKQIWGFSICCCLVALGLIWPAQRRALPAQASGAEGYWHLMQVKNIEDLYPGSIELSLEGNEGRAIIHMKQEQRSATLRWEWNQPPRMLIPGMPWKSKITGSITHWTLPIDFSSTLFMKFQAFEASCCDPYGVDMGMLNLSPESKERVETSRTIVEQGLVPILGELDSGKTSRMQLLVNIVQQGGSFQWVYVYEYVKKVPEIHIRMNIGNARAWVNLRAEMLDSPPYLSANRTFVPFRFIGEAFGALVDYTVDEKTGKTKEVIYELGNDRIVFYLMPYRMELNGKAIPGAPPVEIRNQRVMVPVRILSENLGASVEWKASTQEVSVRKIW